MKRYFENLAKALLGQSYSSLAEKEQKVINSIAEHTTVSENVNNAFSDSLTTGQKIADVVARFGGSWWFISLFFLFIVAWIGVNSYLLIDTPFDPYPYILLNLGLSSLAAFQAPIIMMSQNRQAAKDRIKQDATYEINLKLELQIMRLHTKLDQLSATPEHTDNPDPEIKKG
ncbi:DUF1003 domain-containing protein [Amphritea pacifica]|uniref:DUF1003 domain-containing protein n=1 Tax=Amphritea pacifica TaxID=2811233 RepID=A0ABS2W9H2_9GAMM|nr:DUF1003 domain-containing protein [Amphritea pacifica]MBN0988228.1 DUF1003 domain-containing protein [Amphritea pacifica]MBN1008670.1 DUF1003 domain-containing protein [Amphritea pacifica]